MPWFLLQNALNSVVEMLSCSLNQWLKTWLRRQGQPRGAQVYVINLSDWKGCSQDPPLPRPHLRLAVEAGVSYWRSLCVWDIPRVSRFFFSFVSVSMAAVFGLILIAAEDFATLLSLLCSPLHFNVTDLQPYKCLGIRWRIMECCNHTSLGKTALRPMAARLL